jgi:hypothetical protein
MLAPSPACSLNHKPPDLGIPAILPNTETI